ncbi:MAG: HPr(Ser) kinase/phosphatase [Calditrichaeota bacterium]|nr:HPr(Ser) kinase/phosphatase [Calditrichota bacterium]MCB9391531.1 HPr(Ser) kinase/phosphatase [Calditrichota bacterium]
MSELLQVSVFYQDNQDRLKLKLRNSPRGLTREIGQKEIHRPGLALAGFIELFTFDRVQILGNTEMKYLHSLSAEDLKKSLSRFFEFEIPCLIITNENPVLADLAAAADAVGIAVFTSPLTTTEATHLLSDYLDQKFAPSMAIHASLVDVYGTGLIFTGRSGIGKSEVALDLVERGHRLVSDDIVTLTRTAENVLMGHGREFLKHYMEIRGVGIIDVAAMFGVRAVRQQKRVETEVELVEWRSDMNYDRTGLDENHKEYLGVKIPHVVLPIYPGKNITVIAEAIALNLHLKVYGFHPAREFSRALTEVMDNQSRLQSYLEKDFE